MKAPITASSGASRPREARWTERAFADVPEILQHTVALVLSVISIWAVHLVFALLLGVNAKFFDSIPIKWAFDAAHIAVLARFVWKLVRRIWDT
jgi:hypothetical protein